MEKVKGIQLTPILQKDMAGHKIDDIEMNPCKVIEVDANGKSFIEACEPEEAEFWSVYVHYKDGGLDCIADCETEEQAKQVQSFLLELCNRFVKE